MGFSLCPERGHEGRTRKVPQEDRCSSMYINCYDLSSYTCTHLHCSPFVFLSNIWLSILAIARIGSSLLATSDILPRRRARGLEGRDKSEG